MSHKTLFFTHNFGKIKNMPCCDSIPKVIIQCKQTSQAALRVHMFSINFSLKIGSFGVLGGPHFGKLPTYSQ